ncbi:TIGR02594 family protein [Tistlia consotensis]|uniref:TIGR02594 family protein n=1 Tax=Tistlia consotensis USBA 355 TaxID=560819 RepID=A0A1Y6CCW7_9PROT|nr:TIGR02594 family protein [Tistlia consotensis]SMF47999.1 TIGR02594 family protein [Tistlia consotensis USBA 355]SNR81985.1 TIGR02594 family protein [Tistlia consotensis]
MAVYVVRAGDTLGGLASRLGTTVEAIMALNGHIANPRAVRVGMPLNLPDAGRPVPPLAERPAGEAPWLEIARREMESAARELPDERHNPRIIEYEQSTALRATDDETPWCSAFANWCLLQAGLAGSGSAAARSWLGWGEPLDEPRRGCIVVLSRGEPWQGHVGFLDQCDESRFHLLGANQGDRVSVRGFNRCRLLGLRWPKGA